VDFDGVIAEYDGWRGIGVLGAPQSDVVKALDALRPEGYNTIFGGKLQYLAILGPQKEK
jgi:hypothetical protein